MKQSPVVTQNVRSGTGTVIPGGQAQCCQVYCFFKGLCPFGALFEALELGDKIVGRMIDRDNHYIEIVYLSQHGRPTVHVNF